MSKWIDREKAIEDLQNGDPSQLYDMEDIKYWLNCLPSAEPEQLEKCPIYGGVCLHPSDQCYECPRHAGAEQIIRCTNCRFFKRNIPCTGGRYNGCEMWLDDGNEIRVMTDDYCSKALPKDGEQE